jgi:hypothetical protein
MPLSCTTQVSAIYRPRPPCCADTQVGLLPATEHGSLLPENCLLFHSCCWSRLFQPQKPIRVEWEVKSPDRVRKTTINNKPSGATTRQNSFHSKLRNAPEARRGSSASNALHIRWHDSSASVKTATNRLLLEKLIGAYLLKKFPLLYGTRGLTTFPENPSTGLDPQPVESNPHPFAPL